MSGLHFNNSPFSPQKQQLYQHQKQTITQLQNREDAWLTTAHDDTLNSDDTTMYYQLLKENRNISTALNDIIEPQVIDYHHIKQDDVYITETSTGSFNEFWDSSYTPSGSDIELFSPIVSSKGLPQNSTSQLTSNGSLVPSKSVSEIFENDPTYQEAFRPMPSFKKSKVEWNNPALTPIEALSFDLSFLKNENNENQLVRVNRRTESLMLDGTTLSSLPASPTVIKEEVTNDEKFKKHDSKFQNAFYSNIMTSPLIKSHGFIASPVIDGLQTQSDLKLQHPGVMNTSSTSSNFHPLRRSTLRTRKSSRNNIAKEKTVKSKEKLPPPVKSSKINFKNDKEVEEEMDVSPKPRSPLLDGIEHDKTTTPKPLTEQLKDWPVIWEKVVNNKKKGIYPCTHCRSTFATLYDLAEHIDEYKIHRAHKCPFKECPWFVIGLTRRAEVRRHCSAQHNYLVVFPEDRKVELGKDCSSEELAESLKLQQQPSGIQGTLMQGCKFPCRYEFCSREFKRKDAIQRHEKLVHLNPESRFNKRITSLKYKYCTNDYNTIRKILENQHAKKKKKRHDSGAINLSVDGDGDTEVKVENE